MRKWQGARLGGLVVVLTMLWVGSAQAAVITYTSQALWEAAVAAAGLTLTLEDFADGTLQPGVTTTNGSVGGGVYSGTALSQFNDAGNPRLNFSPGTLALGGSWDFTLGGPGDGLVFMVNGANQFFQGNSGTVPFIGFVGFVSNDATLITALRLDSPGTGLENFTLDDLRFATGTGGGNPGNGDDGGTPVPEPSSLLMLATGLFACAGAARRKRGQSA